MLIPGRVSAFQLSPSSDVLAMYENVRHRLFATVKATDQVYNTHSMYYN